MQLRREPLTASNGMIFISLATNGRLLNDLIFLCFLYLIITGSFSRLTSDTINVISLCYVFLKGIDHIINFYLLRSLAINMKLRELITSLVRAAGRGIKYCNSFTYQ